MSDLKYLFICLLTIIFIILQSTCLCSWSFFSKDACLLFLLFSNIKNINPWSPINTTHSFPVQCFVFGYFWHLFKFITLFLYGFSFGTKFIKAFLDPKIYKYYSGVLGHYYCVLGFFFVVYIFYIFFMTPENILRSGKYVSSMYHVVVYWIKFFTCNCLLQAIQVEATFRWATETRWRH